MAFDILFCLLACAHQLLDTDDDSGWWVFRGELRGGGRVCTAGGEGYLSF